MNDIRYDLIYREQPNQLCVVNNITVDEFNDLARCGSSRLNEVPI